MLIIEKGNELIDFIYMGRKKKNTWAAQGDAAQVKCWCVGKTFHRFCAVDLKDDEEML